MTIEQEFFKAFNIPQKFYTTVNFGDLDNNYQEVSANTLEELFNNYNSYFDEYIEKIEDFMDWRSGYDGITPEIVLGLIKIIVSKDYTFNIWETDMFSNSDKFVSNASNSVRHDIYGRADSFNNAIFALCIQLKDEIQDQVKQLFK